MRRPTGRLPFKQGQAPTEHVRDNQPRFCPGARSDGLPVAARGAALLDRTATPERRGRPVGGAQAAQPGIGQLAHGCTTADLCGVDTFEPPEEPETTSVWGGWGSNPRPGNYEFRALTTELPPLHRNLPAGIYSARAALDDGGLAHRCRVSSERYAPQTRCPQCPVGLGVDRTIDAIVRWPAHRRRTPSRTPGRHRARRARIPHALITPPRQRPPGGRRRRLAPRSRAR